MSLLDIYNARKKSKEEGKPQGNATVGSLLEIYRQRTGKQEEVATAQEEDKRTWFQKGAFEDGYQFGDIVKTILGSKDDVAENLWSGILGIGEKILDAGAMLGTAMNNQNLMQSAQSEMMLNAVTGKRDENVLSRYQQMQEEVEKGTAEFVAKDLYDESAVAHAIISGVNYPAQQMIGYEAETDSVFGEKSDALVQSGGQLLAQMGVNYLVPGSGMALMAASAFGSEAENAFMNDASYDEALLSATISAGAEVLTEKLGGISFGGKTLTDVAFNRLSRKMTSKLAKALITTGKVATDMTAEGAEELLSGYWSAIGQKMSYMKEKEIKELFSKEDALESFIGGVVLGGFGGVSEVVQAKSKGVNPVSGLTKNEEAVVNKVYEDELAEREKNGKLSAGEKTKLYDSVVKNMENGRISTDTIESVLGGDTYKGYQDAVEQESKLKKEIEELEGLPDNAITVKQRERLAEARKELEGLDTKTAKSNLFSEVDKLTANDTKLRESYNERTRRGQAFAADLSQYDAKLRPTIQRAIDNGEINNTRATHAFVEGLAKIEAEKGIGFDFTNNQKLAELGLTVAGRNVGGYVDGTNVTLNLSSSEALNKVVGHEVTHTFEGTEQYDALMTAMKEFAAESGTDWDARVQEMQERYQNVKNADPEKELLADLVGEYLFTDSSFVENLSTKNPGLFKRIYDEIKYLAKTFAGTKQGAALEKVKKTFAEMYRDADVKNTAQTDGVRYKLYSRPNFIEEEWAIVNRRKHSEFDNPKFDLDENRKWMYANEKGYTVFAVYSKADPDNPTVLYGSSGNQAEADYLRLNRFFEEERSYAAHSRTTFDRILNDIKSTKGSSGNGISPLGQRRTTNGDVFLPVGESRGYGAGDNGDGAETLRKTELTEQNEEASDDSGASSLITFSNDYATIRNFMKDDSMTTENPAEKNVVYSLTEQGTAPAGGYRITGGDIALAPTKEDIARMEQEIATAPAAPRNDTEELGAPTREDIANQERDKKLKGPLLMKDSLDRELEKLYRLQQTGQLQDNAYFVELSKVNAAYQAAGRDFNEAFSRVVGAYQGESEMQSTVAGEDSTAVNTDPAQHTPEEQAIIEEYQAAVDENIRGVFEEHLNNPNSEFSRHNIGDVSERQARDAAQLLGGEYTGYKNAINTNGVKHILNEHGPNGAVDVSMADLNDPARIGYVLDNYDSVKIATYKSGEPDTSAEFRTKDNRPAPMLIYKKKVNGTYYVVEAVPESRYKKFWVVSAYMEADSGTQAPDAQNPGNTPNASLASSLSANNNMPQNFDDVKQEEVAAVLGEKDAYVSKQANALYDEVKSMQKGKRVSNTLSYLLDTLDLSEEHKAESYNSLRTALLNIRDNPNQVVNPNSAVEATAREMLGREYDGMAEDFASAEGVAKSIYTKMESLRTELENNQSLREQSNADFDGEIARLQAEYEGKKNKNTKAANDILRRIERTQRLKSQIDADYGKRIDRLSQQLEKISKPEYKTAMQRKAKMEEYTDLMAELVGDTSTWVDKKLGLSYSINTLRRNLRDIVRDSKGNRDIAKADAIYDELQGNYNHNEAELKRESMRIKEVFQELGLNHAEDTYAHMLGEFQYNPDSKLSQEQLEEFYEKHKNKIDTQKVGKAIEEARKVFDDLIVRVNERLKEQGMKQIPYRQGYFPHFTNPKQGWLAKFFNWKPVDNEIPTSIAGLTEEFNPQRSWQSFDKQRTSDDTDYSLEQGLDSYIHGALDWIYHIEDIQKRRALENHIRYVHSEEGIKKRIDEIRNNESYDADEAQQHIDAVYAEVKNPLNNFVTDLRTGTNTLANKKSSMDRKAEEMTNRKIYSVVTNLNSRITANMVVGSFSSALTNFIPITQSWMEVSPVYSLKGMRDTIKATIRDDDGMVNKSDFLTNRLKNEEKLYQTGWDKVSEKAGFLMEAIDSFTSQTVWRSKYLQNMAEGMSETEAIKNADQFAENVIAGRSRGNQPTIFDAKNPITKIFTAFQLEVANQYGYMFKDAPQDSKDQKRLVMGYAKAFLGAYAYNALYSSLVGRDAAFDPIGIMKDLFKGLFGDDEEEPEEAILGFGKDIVEELPFVGGLVGGGRIPISSAIPYSNDSTPLQGMIADVKNGWNDGQPFEDLSKWKPLAKEMLKPLYYLAFPVGGGQLKKFNEGMKMFDDDLPVAGSYTESGNLRFPVEDDSIADWLQAALFGQYASKNAREYFDNGWAPLKEKQIEEFAALDIPIADYREIRKQLGKLETTADKVDYIGSLDLTVEQKNILVNNVVDRKEPVDMTDYDMYEDFDEFDFYIKNQEKYQFLKDNGIAYKTYKASEESREAYNWAFQNPEKYQVSRAVTEDTVTYKSYTKALSEIKADKDSKGNAVAGSRKKKVVQYLNGLDAEYGAKLVLYKMEYPSDDTYNGKIVQYVNGINGFTYEQKATVLQELGFTVTADGRVTWN